MVLLHVPGVPLPLVAVMMPFRTTCPREFLSLYSIDASKTFDAPVARKRLPIRSPVWGESIRMNDRVEYAGVVVCERVEETGMDVPRRQCADARGPRLPIDNHCEFIAA